ncbi:xanthine dehydrogenase small subunit [Glaciecola sp. 1036]|uniref:xanthine dehydrogenase small subunit n=1 Tax=Alteromonadaceae TaxID=72275 RepID=UPI003D08C503
MIRFLLNKDIVELPDYPTDLTVLQYLREYRKTTGTKEGCAAGDCGACTVVVATVAPDGNNLHYKTINACIALLSSINGKQLITVEYLATEQGLHPVQQAMADFHGSQCGFCTPGFVMSLFSLYHNQVNPSREDILHALSGNLCRCTGYRPIIDAALFACEKPKKDRFDQLAQQTIETLNSLAEKQKADLATSGLMLPKDRESLRLCIEMHPEAPLLAGGTDLSLEITQKLKSFEHIISLFEVSELKQIEIYADYIQIGAAVSLSEMSGTLLQYFPQLKDVFYRFASLPIRNQATLGGNVANASPIGDMPPVLMALGASVIADNGINERTLPLRDFFTGYRSTQLADDEWISKIEIPLLTKHAKLAAYKISKRMEDDISAVCAVFKVEVSDEGLITKLATGFGGVAATPINCPALETALVGKNWQDKAIVEIGKEILLNAFTPIDDVRASAQYRKTVLSNLWERFWLEQQQEVIFKTRVIDHA